MNEIEIIQPKGKIVKNQGISGIFTIARERET